ncbi:DUF2326 domain-containing protein [Planomicrobium sp. Y74]|uniref:DUF2326 domain-containing protein n=1 Tax=Planomicrobium sp. Y74 TaxID=2478977 RepID=UPI000EF43DF4|nr:DUF2326 domain-containing protein [Planomicrobium sp. Y74]RLQ91956.1 DUF2326 domain-containing protein [Planomicrobium sp. Y74]
MKILKLIIKKPNQEHIREINFNEIGTSLIYGKVNKPDDEKETSNSIGKTLLLKFVDYIYGANENPTVVKKDISGWVLEAKVKHREKVYTIERVLGISKFKINNKDYDLGEYRDFFEINRNLYSKQLFLSQKNNLISNRNEAVVPDYKAVFELLKLKDLPFSFEEYCSIQDQIKELGKIEKKLIRTLTNTELKEIEERIFLLKKSIKEKEDELNELNSRISNLNVTKEKEELMDEYTEKNYQLKTFQTAKQKLNIEYKRLHQFLKEVKNVDVSAESINKLFEKASYEVPELIKRRIEEVEEFQKKVFYDRKETIDRRLDDIEDSSFKLSSTIKEYESELERLADIISQTEIFQEAISVYQERSSELQNLKFEQGELSKIEQIINERKEREDKLATEYNEMKNTYSKYEQTIEEYKTYIYEMVKMIYTSKVEAYFTIHLKNRHKTHRPFSIDLSLTGDTGEGVGEVRKILVDLLIFNFNNKLEIMMQDSSCFSGIDNRQTSNLIKIANSISESTQKQYIVSLNDYQFNKKDKEFMKLVSNSTIIELDENEKLLKFDY